MQEKKVILTYYSQPHVLQQRMKEEKLTHGDRVIADISPVRLEQNAAGKMVMYFCPMQNIVIKERIENGDGAAIPAEAIINGFAVSENLPSGLYTLKNVELFSNGTMQVNVMGNSEFVDYDHYGMREREMEMIRDREYMHRFDQSSGRDMSPTNRREDPVVYAECRSIEIRWKF